MSKETNIKEIDNKTIEYNGELFTKDQDQLHHKLLKELTERLIKLENDCSFILSNDFSDFIYTVGSSYPSFSSEVTISVNGKTSVTDYRTALLVEEDKAITVKIVSKDKVDIKKTDEKSLTKEEKKQYEKYGFVVVLE